MNKSLNPLDSILVDKPQTSTFDLTHDVKTSFDMGNCVPVNMMECVPGDRITVASEAMLRFMPMISPIMHKCDVTIHHFFVPYRILWQHWEKWITGGADATATPPAFPTLKLPFAVAAGSLSNHLGMPVTPAGKTYALTNTSQTFNAIPHAAYLRIWYDWYRDQNLSLMVGDEFPMLQDGEQTSAFTAELLKMRKRAWELDYFTACLPWTQKGAAVQVPIDLAGTIPVQYQAIGAAGKIKLTDGSPAVPTPPSDDLVAGPSGWFQNDRGQNLTYDPDGTLIVDMANASVVNVTTIEDLRKAMALQKWLELNARAGTRYKEHILANYGVNTADYRLQRAEYLGGAKASMAISEVLQTSETNTTPQGGMAGHGISVMDGRFINYTVPEHGIFMSIISVRPKTAYYQGLPRIFRKTQHRFQYLFPKLANLGENPVQNEEVYYDFENTGLTRNKATFGYLPLYSEYRVQNSRVSGQMATTLDFWHLSRKFDPTLPPVLNDSFVECTPDKRIFAVTGGTDSIVAHILHKIQMRRPLPFYGTPGGV